MNSDWIIKARITKKFPVRTYHNKNGSGKLLNFELIDRHGTQIQATCFNKAVDKFDQILEQDKVYILSKGTVKVSNTKFTSIKNDYCITFSPYSDIRPTDEDNKISKQAFNFVSIKEIETKGEGKSIDLIGVVTSSSELATINLRNGGFKDKRDYTIVDNSEPKGVKIQIALWGMPAKNFNFDEGTVVAFKGLKIAKYKGIALNGGDYTGVFVAKDIGLKESCKLANWYKKAKGEIQDTRSLTIIENPELKGIILTNEYIVLKMSFSLV